jgi:MFS family permease
MPEGNPATDDRSEPREAALSADTLRVRSGRVATLRARARYALAQTFLSLRNRNFLLFFIGQSISNTGNWLTNVALTLLTLRLTGSGVAVGFLAACQYGPILVLSVWGGAIADRYDKRRLLFATQSLEMGQSIGLAVLAFMPHRPMVGLYGLAVIGGVLLSLDNPLRRSFVTEMVRPEDIPNAVVLYSMIVNLSRIFGPALAGLLVTTLGYGWCFSVDAVTYLAVLLCLTLMRPAELYRASRRAGGDRDIRAGFHYLRSIPALWITFGMLAGIGTLAYNFNVTLPLYVTQALHGSDGEFTVIYSVLSAGGLLCGLVVARRGVVTLRQVVYGAAVFGIVMLVFSAAPNVLVAVPMALALGAASIFYTTTTTAIVQVTARPDMHGRLLALQTVLLVGSSAFGGPISGWLADAFGARSLMVIGGVVCLAAAAFGTAARLAQ